MLLTGEALALLPLPSGPQVSAGRRILRPARVLRNELREDGEGPEPGAAAPAATREMAAAEQLRLNARDFRELERRGPGRYADAASLPEASRVGPHTVDRAQAKAQKQLREIGKLAVFLGSPPKKKKRGPEPKPLSAVLRQMPQSVERKVHAVDRQITDIDPLPSRFRGVEKVFLSNNLIESVAGLAQFPQLRVLSIGDNRLLQFEELEAVGAACPRLESANFEGNPMEHTPNYRCQVIKRLPQLKLLDGEKVTEREREEARTMVAREDHLMQMVFGNFCQVHQLYKVANAQYVHLDFWRTTIGRRVFHDDVPQVPQLDVKKLLDMMRFEARLTPAERASIARAIRRQVVRAFNTIRSKHPKLKARWDDAFGDVILTQQNTITRLMTVIDGLGQEIQGVLAGAAHLGRPSGQLEEARREARAGEACLEVARREVARDLSSTVEALSQEVRRESYRAASRASAGRPQPPEEEEATVSRRPRAVGTGRAFGGPSRAHTRPLPLPEGDPTTTCRPQNRKRGGPARGG